MHQPRMPQDPRKQGPKPPFPEQSQATPGEQAKMTPVPDCGEDSYEGLGRLVGRVALVTGADSGIGRAIAIAYAREGADVAVAYLREHEDAERTKQLIEAAGRRALLIAGDLAKPDHCRAVVDHVIDAFGRIDVLVNNAGFQGREVDRFEDLEPDRIEHTFRVNILAMFHLTRRALPHMSPGAAIINTASIEAYQPDPGILDYASTKGAIVTFTKGLAKELIERGIRVNAVAPGPIWTPLVVQSYPAEDIPEEGKSEPIGRMAQPVEVAPAFVFLASNEARYVNGEILGVTGKGGLP